MKEARIQSSVVRWFRYEYPELSKLFLSTLNGAYLYGSNPGQRAANWNKLKRQGAVKGAADTLLLVPRGGFGCLCLEFKTGIGRQRDEQADFELAANANGNLYKIARSFEEGIEIITNYLNGKYEV